METPEHQKDMIADDISYAEMAANMSPEQLAEIEARIEARWLDEFRRFSLTAEERTRNANIECSRWRGIVIAMMQKAKLPGPLSTTLFHDAALIEALNNGEEPVTEQFMAILEKLEMYLQMGVHFEVIVQAVKSDDALESIWETLMMTMRLTGNDGSE